MAFLAKAVQNPAFLQELLTNQRHAQRISGPDKSACCFPNEYPSLAFDAVLLLAFDILPPVSTLQSPMHANYAAPQNPPRVFLQAAFGLQTCATVLAVVMCSNRCICQLSCPGPVPTVYGDVQLLSLACSLVLVSACQA